jgi:polynucleotide 5'-hydroxyl-kinase GRC3/NOL9
VVFSTFQANSRNAAEQIDGSVILKLLPTERLLVIGEYDLAVLEGQVLLLGATLTRPNQLYRVYAPSAHSLPVIRCSGEVDHARIQLYQTSSGLRTLKNLSPLFGRMFDDYAGPLGNEYKYHRPKSCRNKRSTFQTVSRPSRQN